MINSIQFNLDINFFKLNFFSYVFICFFVLHTINKEWVKGNATFIQKENKIKVT